MNASDRPPTRRTRPRGRSAWAACAVPLAMLGAPAAAHAEVLLPTAKLSVDPPLSAEDDEANNVSGAACYVADGKRKSCLLIGDEVRYARLFSIDGDTVVPGDKVYILPERDARGDKFKETDAEGVAFADGFYYLVGSHGLNKKGKKQLSRYFVYRVKVDADTGRPSDLGDGKSASRAVERSDALERYIAAHPVLNAHIGDIPGRQGVNVEGIAVRGGDLYFGFRGPVEKKAVILKVPIGAVFEGDVAAAESCDIDLGGEAIRDLAAVEGGLLVLTGPEPRTPGKAHVFLWKPDERRLLADLGGPRADGGQPEALLVMRESAAGYSIIVFSDGPTGGDPTSYDISK